MVEEKTKAKKTEKKTEVAPQVKKEEKKTETKKIETKDDEKVKELKIELLKSGSKRQKIKREIAKILTLQNKNKMEKSN